MLKHGAIINPKDDEGITPLHYACKERDIDAVKILKEAGAEVNDKDKEGTTPLHIAAKKGSEDVVAYLLKSGAEINVNDIYRKTPLDYAIENDDTVIISILKKPGGINTEGSVIKPKSLDINNKWDIASKFRSAVGTGDLSKVRIMLVEYPELLKVHFIEGTSPLHFAAIHGEFDIAKFLLAQGADPNYFTRQHELTPLFYASNKEIAELLLSSGANINAKSSDGKTPLHYPMAYNEKVVAELIIAKGVDVNSKDNNGMTPLHTAVLSGRAEIVSFLLDKGASTDARDNKGQSPFDIASQKDNKDIEDILRKYENK